MSVRQLVKNSIQSLGWDIVRYPTPLIDGFTKILLQNKFTLVLDVGANDGSYAKLLRRLGYHGKVISFEPLIAPFKQLEEYARRSSYPHEVLNCALGEYDGKANMHVSQNTVSSSLLPSTNMLVDAENATRYVREEETELFRLDTLWPRLVSQKEEKVFLKMDVQGYEKYVLAGATQSLSKIDGIQLEVALIELYAGETLAEEMWNWIRSQGFSLHLIIPGFQHAETGRLLEMDCIFIRDVLL